MNRKILNRWVFINILIGIKCASGNQGMLDIFCSPDPEVFWHTPMVTQGTYRCIYKDIIVGDNITVSYVDRVYQRNIDKILFENSIIPDISAEFFNAHRDTEIIEMSGINLRTLPSDTFNNMRNLIQLNLSMNYIEKIPSDIFINCPYLRRLDASHNLISSVEFIGESMTYLKELYLSHNKIIKLGYKFLLHQTDLTALYLDNNQIDEFPKNIIANKKYLSYLKLNDNPLKIHIDPEYSSIFSNLGDLDLSNISLSPTEISVDAFITNLNKCNLTEITLGDKITTLNAENNRISNVIINSNYPSIYSINLSHNNLSSIKNLSNLNGLRKLDISFNCISTIGYGTFSNLSNLEELNLREICLKKIEFKTFGRLDKLKSLHMSFNKLNGIDFNTFYGLVSLEQFYLFGNDVTSKIGVESINKQLLPNLKTIHIFIDHWECYSLESLINQLRKANVNLITSTNNSIIATDYIEGIPCIYNSTLSDIIKRMNMKQPDIHNIYESGLGHHIERLIKEAINKYSQSKRILIKDRLKYNKETIINETMELFDRENKELKDKIDEIISGTNRTKFEDILLGEDKYIKDLVVELSNSTEHKFNDRLLKISEDVKNLENRFEINENNTRNTNLINPIQKNKRIDYNGTFIIS